MNWLRHVPIKRKLTLVIVGTCFAALVLACAALGYYHIRDFLLTKERDSTVLMDVVGRSTQAALVFNDENDAQQKLQALVSGPGVTCACIYAADGKLFAQYTRSEIKAKPPASPPSDGMHLDADDLEVVRPVLLNHKRIGTILMRSDLRGLYDRMRVIGEIVSAVLLGCVLATFALSSWLQRPISRPILALTQNVRSIAESKDYTLRVPAQGRDETGLLTEAFNQLLAGIEERDTSLRLANESLRRSEAELHALALDLERRVEERTLELRESEERLQDLYNKAPCGYHSANTDGVFVRINDTELAWLGYTREELIGKKKHRDFVSPATKAIYDAGLALFLATGQVNDLEFEWVSKDGTKKAVLLNATAVRDADGKILHSRTTVFDITHRKNTEAAIQCLNQELNERAAQLEAANKEMEAFSYSVSHDLRAPLRHVQGYVEMLNRATEGQLSDKARRYLKTISDASVEMGQLIDDLLAFSRMGRVELQETRVSLDALVQDTVRGLEMATNGRNIAWKIRPLPPVLGDPATLKQVMANLIGNAVKYSRQRDPAEIEIGCGGDEEGRAILFVRDNGAGFDMKYAQKLFGVFQRLHRAEEFEGTGIGLATVRRIIGRHGGRTWAEGVLQQGATFYFTLKMAT